MAQPPKTDEAFLREVDEELRREQLGTFWQVYGRWLAALVLVLLAVLGSWLWWQDRRDKAAAADGETLSQAIDDIAAGRAAEADKSLEALAAGGSEGYAALARFGLASRMIEKGDATGAARAYDAIAADEAVAQPLRDLALLRSVAVQFDTLKPEKVVERLKPLASPGAPWFGTAGELTAAAWIKAGRPDMARATLDALAKDEGAPRSIRDRAERLALSLEAGAPAPATAKE